jgi:hypothetical protein
MPSILCRNGSIHTHHSLDDSRRCYGVEGVTQQQTRPTPMDVQFADERHPGTDSRGADRHEEAWDDRAGVTRKVAEGELQAHEAGVYRLDERIYRLYKSRSSDNMYAKILAVDTDGKRHWAYAKGVYWRLRVKHRLTEEEARDFGQQFGVCVNCLADLTRGESIRRGYGPKCADNHGWPYDHKSKD